MNSCVSKITVLAENDSAPGLGAEHGLSMLIEHRKNKILFDFGASSVWLENAKKMNIDLSDVKHAFLSHGHNDHTGGLQFFSGTIFCHPEIDSAHFSLHPGKAPGNLTMPIESQKVLHKSKVFHTDEPCEILPGIFCTGEIPRLSNEDCGGPFFTGIDGAERDFITDESALLLDNGTLIHGCCHSGIINTVEHCSKIFPAIKIRTVIGGLHLLHADTARLDQTAAFLKSCGIEKLYLMHCTGNDAIVFLRHNLTECDIRTIRGGDIITV